MKILVRYLLYTLILISPLTISAQFSGQIGAQQIISSPDAAINSPSSILGTDFDGDGDIDIISGSLSSIVLFENLGNNVFADEVIITSSVNDVLSIYAADMDDDGDDDLLSASAVDNKIAWYENLGDGTFGIQQVISTSGIAPWKVHVADMDDDNDLDVLVASSNDHKIAWYANLGLGTFSSEQIITTNLTYAKSVYAADLDGDNDMDILAISETKVCLYENLGAGSFGPQQELATNVNGGFSIIASDLDNDLDLDICYVSKFDDIIYWQENLGGATFGPQQIIDSSTNSPFDIYAEDFNGDGLNDLVAAFYADRVVYYENTGAGTFGPPNVITLQASDARSVSGADLNNDGLPDILSASQNDDKVSFYLNQGGNNFDHQQNLTGYSKQPSNVATADLDNDGFEDVYTTGNGDWAISWYKNLGNEKFSHQKIIGGINYGNSYALAADVDSDGLLDIIGTQSNYDTIRWYKNLGDGMFSDGDVISTTTSGPGEIVFSDMNNDGIGDFIYSASGNVYWKANWGGGNFGTENLIASAGSKIYIVDLDNDGDNDIISGGFNVFWIQNLGGGNFNAPQQLNSGGGPTNDVFSFDVDLNGFNDVIWSYSNNICVFYNNGGSFSNVDFIDVLPNFSVTRLFCEDMDDDGDIDILASNSYDQIVAWENLNNSVFSPAIIVTTMVDQPSGVCLADLNNDGDMDILSSSINDDKLAWYENHMYNNAQITGRVYLDLNLSGTFDSTDIGVSQIAVLSNPLSDFCFVDTNGYYNMNFSDSSGSYLIYPDSLMYWDIVTDSSTYLVIIDSSYYHRDSLDFGLYPNSIVDTLDGDLVGGFPLCNSVNNLWIGIDNFGTTIPSGIISLQLDDNLTYQGADITPDSIVGQTIYWSYDSLYYFDNYNVNVQVLMPDFNSINDTVTNILAYNVDSLGTILFTGSDTLIQVVTCAYDPNDKTVTPEGVGNEGYIDPETSSLEYTIRFQNTGNDTAQVVVLTDQLDEDLIWQSLNILSSSHYHSVSVDQNGLVTFTFNDIQLPDSSTNAVESQGFIKYRIDIKPNLPTPTVISNSANIYFDQNPAVVTNITVNTIYDCINVFEENFNATTVCPLNTVTSSIPDSVTSTEYLWTYMGNTTIGSDFSWFADSVGLFDLELSIYNIFCSEDSIVQINSLAPIQNTFIDSTEICYGDSIMIFNNYQSQSGIFYDTLQSIYGCDSVLVKQLNISSSIPQYIDSLSICDGDSILVFNAYQSQSGDYFDTLQSYLGCDSVVAMNIAVFTPAAYYFVDTVNVCSGDSAMIFTSYEDQTGMYYDSLSNSLGCDSVVAKYLMVETLPTILLISTTDEIIGNDGAIDIQIIGSNAYEVNWSNSATTEDLSGLSGGDYIVIVTDTITGCDVVDTITVNSQVELIEQIAKSIVVYPNPNSGQFEINAGDYVIAKIIVIDQLGRIVERFTDIDKSNYKLNLKNIESGLYQLIIETTRGTIMSYVIIQN